jgi:hypothetical protein
LIPLQRPLAYNEQPKVLVAGKNLRMERGKLQGDYTVCSNGWKDGNFITYFFVILLSENNSLSGTEKYVCQTVINKQRLS